MEKITKTYSENVPLEEKKQNVEKLLNEAKFEIDLRYFVLINGIFDQNLYRNIRNLTGFLKYVKKYFFTKKFNFLVYG